ncbi:MAG TPA: DUF2085 domain-containing protein [Anaerolineales bacterium]|nr:DUF2085 domain-containing protein [Anaerolineales bacterium]
MTGQSETQPAHWLTSPAAGVLALGVFALIVGTWLANTPPDLLGKADAIGYAICHRIDLRSFHLGDRQMPLCARCTGIYLGALASLITLAMLGRGRAGGLPTAPFMVVLIAFIGVMGVDGVNSYMGLFQGRLPQLYTPSNELRLITGALTGIAVAGLIYPVFNQTLWRGWTLEPMVGRWRDLALLLGVNAVVVALVLTNEVAVLYPLALLSALGVLVLLTMLYTIGVLLIARRDATLTGWRQAALPLLLGLTLAIVQIAVVDAVRYGLFGTWAGLPLAG